MEKRMRNCENNLDAEKRAKLGLRHELEKCYFSRLCVLLQIYGITMNLFNLTLTFIPPRPHRRRRNLWRILSRPTNSDEICMPLIL